MLKLETKEINMSYLSLPLSSASSRRLNKSWTKKESQQDKLCLIQLAQVLDNQLRQQLSSAIINDEDHDDSKIISSPSMSLTKFVDLTNKLMNRIGLERQTVTVKNYTFKIPKISLMLHYPAIVQKSWLKTVNALHSWPNVLAWFSWLVALAETKTKAEVLFQVESIPFVHYEKKPILELIVQCKRNHDRGDFDEEQKIMLEYMKNETNSSDATEQCLSGLASQLEQLEENYLKNQMIFEGVSKENLSLKQTVDYLKNEVCKCDKFLMQNNSQLEERENCKILRQAELALLEYEIEEKTCNISQIEAALFKQQKCSNVNAAAEMEMILLSILEKQQSLQHLEQSVSSLEQRVSELDQSIEQMNSNAICLINSRRTELFISQQDTDDDDDRLLKMLNEKGDYINSCKMQILTNVTNLEQDIQMKRSELESLNKQIQTIDSKHNEMKEKQSSCRKEIDKTKRRTKEREETLGCAISKLNQELLQTVGSVVPSSDLDILCNQLSDTKFELKQLQERKAQLKHKIKSFFETLLKCKSDNKDF